jgi:hypothetical protein
MACLRLAHIHLLWADEDYHIAASIFILNGKIPYRDFWYDKPPLNAIYYLIIGGFPGWPLRLLDAFYVGACCAMAWRLARGWWGESEAWTAALLLAFFTTFYLPSAIVPFAPDALMVLPHLAAIWFAWRRRAFLAGACTGIAFFLNTKALFVLLVCAVWLIAELPLLAAGFAVMAAAGLGVIAACGAWPGYIEQVWRWGFIYARNSPEPHPFLNGIKHTGDWLGFHAALAIAATYALIGLPRREAWRMGVWLAASFAAVCVGLRFAPHYFLQFLPPLVIIAARGTVRALHEHRRPAVAVLALALIVPVVRFGPRYVSLALDDIEGREPHWIDVVLDLDSRHVAEKILALRRPGDTLFVWGYRPSMYVYTRMIPPGLFWDSQPLTGVPADRHLHETTVVYSRQAEQNRERLTCSKPAFLVDGLGLLNSLLSPGRYPDLKTWLAHYREVARTELSLIYRRERQ